MKKRGRLISIMMCLMLALMLFSMVGHGFEMQTVIVQAAEKAGYKIMIENQNVTDGNFSMENANVDVVIMPVNQTEGFDLLGNTVAVPVITAISERLADAYSKRIEYRKTV